MQTITGRRGKAASLERKGKTGKKGPGRPEGASNLRDGILDAAEEMFANLGYAGTTMREVSQHANVTQALISYYFGSKYGLFEEVFLRRGSAISDERLKNLDTLQAQGQAPSVRAIVEAFLLPTVVLRTSVQGRHFLRLQARLHTEPPNISYALRDKAYGTSTQRYVDALKEAVPGLTDLDANWRITLMVGTYLYAFSDSHRMEERLPDGQYNPEDWQSLIQQVTSFVVGGMSA
ncbi:MULTISPECIES: TetR/AcrR family transcriptional regulator [unclassified Pseudomonas]|uniref:TetR/AcrR family transcriptional regulator n=1 Tax=unclassified Pseudomonas TaxID=196821 RepID=UPI000D3B0CC5|nr:MULTISPECIES: TetR/AcrR family transcriptional regulator [unclassified Pseudomonas]RAU45414.1 TetR/AcrR family transcriptional regulator [Pseudomonas sp. RIT 409]RAU53202.1 TetR/AcrR family transcriptional regulator [Pseudomonas sp. RIT 412]